ncbi:hypothetical protein [Azomonas macrocytogenes]|uniref:Uncharacterized protein n=1 Tax=Azomonas macrocytogenes TaxID=69962 RepID=A0A839TBK5_AZOMA|nr:hypothetical protein [Azomonas macrocytogenes]MBB3105504.1 hypothetical protein [Azomonas macrocytogenes]
MTNLISQTFITINGMRLPFRNVEIDGVVYQVPKGISRNKDKKRWQIKFERNGVCLIIGGISDSKLNPAASLEKAIALLSKCIDRLTEKQLSRNRKHNYKYISPLPISKYMKLIWRVSKTTPTLYAYLYSPCLKKDKFVIFGSHKLITKNQNILKERMAIALLYNARIEHGDHDPYRAINEQEIDKYIDLAKSKITNNINFMKFIQDGLELNRQLKGI